MSVARARNTDPQTSHDANLSNHQPTQRQGEGK